MTQAPTPGPLSGDDVNRECKACGAFKAERDAACTFCGLAPTAPVEASGSEREAMKEALAELKRIPAPLTDDGEVTSWDARNEVAAGIHAAETWLERALNLRPQPSGETREGLVYLADDAPVWADGIVTDGERVALAQKAEADYGGTYWATDDGGVGAVEWEPTHFIDMNTLLSAHPLALGEQQGEACRGCGHVGPVPKDRIACCPDGKRYDTTPARAEALDEGVPYAWALVNAHNDTIQRRDQMHPDFALLTDEDLISEGWTPLYAHPSPTPAADADRVRIAVEALEEADAALQSAATFIIKKWGTTNPARERAIGTVRQALAALKSEGK